MLHAEGLVKRFGDAPVLDGLSLRLPTGETRCLLGGSGSGKSVTLRLLTGLLPLDAGRIRYDGVEVQHGDERQWQAVRAQVGMVFQQAALLDSLTVAENVGLRLAEIERIPAADRAIRVAEALAQVGLPPELADRLPGQLSGGQRKRVGIARAIVHRPRYLFYDEPTTGLDPATASTIDDLIATFAAQPGVSSLIVTHDLDTVHRLNAPVWLLAEGRLVWDGTASDFFATDEPLVQAFRARRQS